MDKNLKRTLHLKNNPEIMSFLKTLKENEIILASIIFKQILHSLNQQKMKKHALIYFILS